MHWLTQLGLAAKSCQVHVGPAHWGCIQSLNLTRINQKYGNVPLHEGKDCVIFCTCSTKLVARLSLSIVTRVNLNKDIRPIWVQPQVQDEPDRETAWAVRLRDQTSSFFQVSLAQAPAAVTPSNEQRLLGLLPVVMHDPTHLTCSSYYSAQGPSAGRSCMINKCMSRLLGRARSTRVAKQSSIHGVEMCCHWSTQPLPSLELVKG